MAPSEVIRDTGPVAGAFLQELWHGFDGEGIITFAGPGKTILDHLHVDGLSSWDLEHESLLRDRDVWIFPTLRPVGIAPTKAGVRHELVAHGAFTLDIDLETEGHHKAKRLPRTLEEAAPIIDAGPEPTHVVWTGGGIHLWWFFHPIALLDRAARARSQRISERFHEPFHRAAEALGFHLDNTAGIERRFRLPGSANTKRGLKQVTLLYQTEEKYSFEDFVAQFDGRRTKQTEIELPTPKPIVPFQAVEEDPPTASIPSGVALVRSVLRKFHPTHKHKQAAEAILKGESFASEARDDAMAHVIATIVMNLDRRANVASQDVAEVLRPSLEHWAAEPDANKTLEEELAKAIEKTDRMFEKREREDLEKAKTAEVIRRALRMNGNEVPDEKKISIDQLQQLAIIQHNNAFYVHGFGAQTKKHPLPPGFYGPFIEKATIPALADLWENCPEPFGLTYWTEPTKKNPEGVLKQKTVPGLMREYGSLALNVIGDLSLAKSYFDIETRIFHEAICSPRELEPAFDPLFDEYLHVTFENAYDKFVDYLSYFLRLDVAIGAPYLEGPSGAGKGALVAGLSRFWGTTGPTDYERIAAADFNAFRVPFIVLDEGLTMSRKTSAHIRHLIATGSHTINPKGFAQYVVNGHVRVMFTANNKHVFAQITANEELSEDDIEAISKRFIYFRMSDDAPRWLEERNGKDKIVTRAWVEGDGIAKHVLWLNQNRQAQVVPGKRFIVEGESSEIHRALVTRGEKRGLILEWLAHFATNPDPVTRFYATTKKECLAVIGNGELLVNTRAVSENWSIYGEKSPCLTTTMIGRILGQISTRVRIGYDGGDTGARFHKINFDHVLDWAGGDAQIGDLKKMRENFNRKIEQ